MKKNILVLNLYNKLVGFLIKRGKKNKAKFIVNKALLMVSKKTGYSSTFLVLKLFSTLNVFVEAKTIKVRNKSHVVPLSIGLKRRSYLVIKWLMQSILENDKKISMVKKVAYEIFRLIIKKKSKSLKLRKKNNELALSNRSNIHYRW